MKIWDIRGGYVTHTFRGHSGIISALCFFAVSAQKSRDGSSVAVTTRRRPKRIVPEERPPTGRQVSGEDVQDQFRLASGGEDGKIRVWDLHKRQCVSVLDSHVSVIRGLDYSSDENALVSGSRDKTVIVWDARSWKPRVVVPVLEGVECTGFLAHGKLIYTGGEQGKVRLWSLGAGKEVTKEQPSGGESESIVDIIHPQGLDWFISVHADQSLLLHSLKGISDYSGEGLLLPLPIIRRISGTHDEVIDLAYLMPDNSYLALATNSEDVRIISVETAGHTSSTEREVLSGSSYFGADIALLKGHDDIIICLDVDWSGQWLVTGAKDNTARLWRIDPENLSFACFAVFTGHAESLGAISLPKLKPSGEAAAKPLEHPPAFVVTGSQDQTIKYWVIPRSQPLKLQNRASQARYTRKAHDKDINAIDINHNSTLFASASQDRTVKVWSVEEGEVQGILRGHRRGVWSVRFAPKDTPTISGDNGSGSGGRGMLLTGSGDKSLKIWSLVDYSCLRTFEGHTNSVLKVLWLPSPPSDTGNEGQRSLRLASAGGDGLVKIWDASSGEVSCTLDNHTDRIWALTINRETHTLVSGGGDGVITFWKDTTSATAAAASTAAVQQVEQEQQLQNFIHARAYREAITLALQLNHPGRLLALFTSVVNTTPAERGSLSGLRAVDEVLSNLSHEQIYLLLLRIRDWNTNARTAPIAQRILWVLVKTYPASKFVNMRGIQGAVTTTAAATARGAGIKEILDGLKAYTERHYRRMEDLMDESYLVDFTLREMDELSTAAASAETSNGGARPQVIAEIEEMGSTMRRNGKATGLHSNHHHHHHHQNEEDVHMT